MKNFINNLGETLKDLKGKPLIIVVLCVVLIIGAIIFAFSKFILVEGTKKERPMTEHERMVKDEREKVEEELDVERNKYGEVKYDEQKLLDYAYSTEGAPKIDDKTVDKLNLFADEKMETFDFNNASDTMVKESKSYETTDSEAYNETTRVLIDDLVMAGAIEDSYISEEELTKENLSNIVNDKVYFYAIMSIDPDYKTRYTIDKDSISASISKEASKTIGLRLQLTGEIQPVTSGRAYNVAKKVLPYNVDTVKEVPFKWGENEFLGYFAEGEGKRDFIGYYDKDPSNPSGLTTVRQWEDLVKEKREMRDPATSNWQEGGPDTDLMPRPDLTEEAGDFGAGEFEEPKDYIRGPQGEAEWPEELEI